MERLSCTQLVEEKQRDTNGKWIISYRFCGEPVTGVALGPARFSPGVLLCEEHDFPGYGGGPSADSLLNRSADQPKIRSCCEHMTVVSPHFTLANVVGSREVHGVSRAQKETARS